MGNKIALLVGLGAGYVLGSRAGRGRYEQISSKASELWHDPRVQEKAEQARELAKQKAPTLTERVSQAAGKASSSGGGHASTSSIGASDDGTPVHGRTSYDPGADGAAAYDANRGGQHDG